MWLWSCIFYWMLDESLRSFQQCIHTCHTFLLIGLRIGFYVWIHAYQAPAALTSCQSMPLIMHSWTCMVMVSPCIYPATGRKHWALRPQKPLRLIRDGKTGGWGGGVGWGVRNFITNTYSLLCHHQNDSALRWAVSCVSHFNVSLIVWTKSKDSVHKPQFLKRKESRSGSNQGPSAYQPSALTLGHTGAPCNSYALGLQ